MTVRATHHIGRLTVECAVADLDSALALRARVEDMARQAMPPVLERVFDALVPDGRHLRLGRLDLDLGTVAADRLEQELPAALERALSDALTGAIAAALHAPVPDGRFMEPGEALLDRFDAYLASGTMPFGAATAADPTEDLRRLLAERPAALAALLHRRATDRHALERLVLQAGTAELRALLALLAPADATVILTYLAELLRLHRKVPALPISGSALERRLWLLTLDHLLRDAGTRFNRRMYLRFLVAGAARAEGIAYAALLLALRAAAARTRRQRPLGDSLPGLLDALAAELPADADAPAADGGEDDAFLLAEAGDVMPLLALLRRRADDDAILSLTARLSGAVFARLVRALEPQHAALILVYVAELSRTHRAEALLTLSDAAFEPLLRLVVLRLLLRDAGTQFNRRSWLRRLLHDLAAQEDVPYDRLLATLTQAMRRLRHRLPPTASLPALIGDLAAELPAGRGAALPWPPERDPAMRRLTASLKRRGTATGRHSPLPQGRARTALVEALATDTSVAWRRLAERTAAADRAGLLRWLTADPALLIRFAAALGDRRRDDWLAALDPADGAGARAAVRELRRLHAGQPLTPLDGEAFARLVWTLTVQALAGGVRPPAGRTALLRDLLARLARHQGIPTSGLTAALWPRVADPALRAALPGANPPDPPDPLTLVEGFLRTGEPPAGGPALAEAAESHAPGLAALLRRLVAADAGRTAALIGRLLAWLPPEDIVDCLQPGRTVAAARWAAVQTGDAGGDGASAWSAVLDHILRGEPVPEAPGTVTDALPEAERAALLRHWLDRGALPDWAPPGTLPSDLLDGLTAWPLAEVLTLFGDTDAGPNAARLRRAADRLGWSRAEAALRRLAPWVFATDGPLSARMHGLAEGERRDLSLRAVAATLSGQPFDLEALDTPPDPTVSGTADSVDVPANRAALIAFLAGAVPTPAFGDGLIRLTLALADARDPELDAALCNGLSRAGVRAGWVAVMPDEILARLVHRLEPGWARPLLALTTVLTAAWRQAAAPDRRGDARRLVWSRLFAVLAGPRASTMRATADRLIAGLTGGDPEDGRREAPDPVIRDPVTTARVLARARELARDGGYTGLSALLRPRPPRRPPPPAPRRGSDRAGDSGVGETLYVGNAGLILFNPFLPHFFERLGVLTHGGDGAPAIVGTDAASRAVHLLQYLVDEHCDRPEPQLVLNKLLCGVVASAPVLRAIEPTEAERSVCDEMLRAVIGNWTIIRNTSPAGLRETFLQREGRLQRGNDRWTLEIQRKTVDILTDQVPWNRSVVYHRWMAAPIHVTW
ncbi:MULTISPECIES: contractile injection system tape measure protein [Azospirillum]|uniref:contractile injection system tape measure protein n=1 Tax=Azospirillum TaxID=191 RepID=UPI0024832993|nr:MULTISPECIES: contractile injection system tape measure protein [Azospirillum]MDW5531904.1 contractile injection system tape measure protein [Azospirillum sp. NL1]